jgi:cytochrome c-type biogenesis protein CcsB
MKKLGLFLLLFIFMTLNFVHAREMYFCNSSLESLPVQQGGRVKPLFVHAKESIKFLTGKSKVGTLSAVEAYCLLSLKSFGLATDYEISAKIEHTKVRKLLELKDQYLVPYPTLVDSEQDIRFALIRIKEENSYKKALTKLMNKIFLYKDFVAGTNWNFPEFKDQALSWTPLKTFLKEEKIKAIGNNGSGPFLVLFENTKKTYIAKKGDIFLLELKYAKASLPHWALLFTLMALAALVLFKRPYAALGLSTLTILLQIAHMALRIFISGRAPVTNMYETVLFSGFVALTLGLIIGHFKKDTTFVYTGLMYNTCTLFMINFAGNMLSPNIGPLVPVLRDNFWLSTHVTCVVASYGALALSWVLANTALIKNRFFGIDKDQLKYYSELSYTCIKYGIVLLAAGVILGGVWADYSWGRFWGWDPKETWSLIVLCIYAAILHGRYTSWIPNSRFIPLCAGAFMSVMMAWFGVNYILASGLHSYGFSEGGAIFLGTFFALQTLLILVSYGGLKNAKTVTQ